MPAPDAAAVLFDVDGTLVDAVANQRRIWATWADRFRLDGDEVYSVALRTRPVETAAHFLPEADRARAVEHFHRLEDDDVHQGQYKAFTGVHQLLRDLEPDRWALVTANLRRRVEGRFRRLALPVPRVIVDAESTVHGKPHPAPYLAAAAALGVVPARCLVVEDSASGVAAGLAAGMTVWTVNGPVPLRGAHRHFPALSDAAPDVLRFVG
ncbi:HAD-IA family hydrolase [Cellulomonas humilata]|uniref:Sugar-phosphatase n=1 Tax=Cellulomonas humilata TaxID=144055 RepID=A0ABU0EL46_9CELL|nr:HAD-IA family hydrolase [Cellulomonas humilata]MDQ0375745.1 sugar-phosphatase [Cellulomonas humilata]